VKQAVTVALIRSAIEGHEGTWADLGAGRGIFTRALADILGPASRIHAIDAEPAAVAALQEIAKQEPRVTAHQGDFTQPLALPPLDGILLANSLHFHRDSGAILAKLVQQLRPGGRVVLVEYDRREASRWVPYPIAIASLRDLAKNSGLDDFTVVESRPSDYEGIIYVAVANKSNDASE
jgi:trans-aconitate methyltransferase